VVRGPPDLGRTRVSAGKQALQIPANHARADAEFTRELTLNAATGKISQLPQAAQDGLLPDQSSNLAYRINVPTA
jgi:hypothetical protein